MALEYKVITVPQNVVNTDFEVVISAPKLIIISVDVAGTTFKVGDDTQDAIPAREVLELCAEDGDVFDKIFVTNAIGGATDELVIIAVKTGNINAF